MSRLIGRVPLASSGQRPGALLNILQGTGSRHRKEWSGPVSVVRVSTLALEGILTRGWENCLSALMWSLTCGPWEAHFS